MTLGAAAAAQLRSIVWCKAYRYRVEADPTARHREDMLVLNWWNRLVCSRCSNGQAGMVVIGQRR